MIAYKVVHGETRFGSNAMIYDIDLIAPLLEKYPKLYPFFPRYTPGKTIYQAKGSPGIMAFTTPEDAKDFAYLELPLGMATEYRIIKIKGHKRNLSEGNIWKYCGSSPWLLISNDANWLLNQGSESVCRSLREDMPPGTLRFRSVTVLE